MASSQVKYADGWEVHTFQIGVNIGDCAIHLLVKNPPRYEEGDDVYIPTNRGGDGQEPLQLLEKPTFREVVDLDHIQLPEKGGLGHGEVHAALLFDGGHDDTPANYDGRQTAEAIKDVINDIEQQYKFADGGDSVAGTPLRRDSLANQLIFDAWIVTHWDRDHYCGALTLFRNDIFDRLANKPDGAGPTDNLCSYFKYSADGKPASTLYCPVWKRSSEDKATTARGAPSIFGDGDDHNKIWLTDRFRVPLDFRLDPQQDGIPMSGPLFNVSAGEQLIGIDFFTGVVVGPNAHPSPEWYKGNLNVKDVVHSYMATTGPNGTKPDDKRPVFLCVGSNGHVFVKGKVQWKKAYGTPDNFVSIMALIVWKTNDGVRLSHICGGDAHVSTEEAILQFLSKPGEKDKFWPVEVMKASHHGARTSTPVQLVRACMPSKFLISAGDSHGHPSWQTVALLVTYFRSQRAGGKWRIKELPLYSLRFPYYLPSSLESLPTIKGLSTTDMNLESYRSRSEKTKWQKAFAMAYGNDRKEPKFYGDEVGLELAINKIRDFFEEARILSYAFWAHCSVTEALDQLFGYFDLDPSYNESLKPAKDARKKYSDEKKKAKSKTQSKLDALQEELKDAEEPLQEALQLHRHVLAYYIRRCWNELSSVTEQYKEGHLSLRYVRIHASMDEKFDGRAMVSPRRRIIKKAIARRRHYTPNLVTTLLESFPSLALTQSYAPTILAGQLVNDDDALGAIKRRSQPEQPIIVGKTGLIIKSAGEEDSFGEKQGMDRVIIDEETFVGGDIIIDIDAQDDTMWLESEAVDTSTTESFVVSGIEHMAFEKSAVLKTRQFALASTAKATPAKPGKRFDAFPPELVHGLATNNKQVKKVEEAFTDGRASMVNDIEDGHSLLHFSGPMLFSEPVDVSHNAGSKYVSLKESDNTMSILKSIFWSGADGKDNAESLVRKIEVQVRQGKTSASSLGLDDIVVHLAKTPQNDPLVFSARKEVLNIQFETETTSPRSQQSGIERFPGHLILGLENSTATGGFESLLDMFHLVGITPSLWLQPLLNATKVKITRSPRNGIWYLPSESFTTALRLSSSLDVKASVEGLGSFIKPYLNKLNITGETPSFSVIAKRSSVTVVAPLECYVDTKAEIIVGTKLDVADLKEGLGIYVSLVQDSISITLLSYDQKLKWSLLKDWIVSNCQDLVVPLTSLEGNLKTLANSRSSDQKVQGDELKDSNMDGIFWRRLNITVGEKGRLLGASISFEASMPYLVSKGTHAVFDLEFSWSPGNFEFYGEFIGANAMAKSETKVPPEYVAGYEVWNSPPPLTKNPAPVMSFRYIDPEKELGDKEIPYGVPTDITMCDLYVSNKKTVIKAAIASVVGKPSSTGNTPGLSLDYVDLHFAAQIDYSASPVKTAFLLEGVIALTRPPYSLGGPQPQLQAAIGYNSGAWSFEAQATNIEMTSLYFLFAEGSEREGVMEMLEHITLNELSVAYTYAGSSLSEFSLIGEMGIAGIAARVEYNRSSNKEWTFVAKVSQDQLKKVGSQGGKEKLPTLSQIVGELLGSDIADLLPPFIGGTALTLHDPAKDKLQLMCTTGAFGVEASLGVLHIQFAQVKSAEASKSQTDETSSKTNPVKKLIRASLGPLPTAGEIPVVGTLKLPFEQVEFLWASAEFTKKDLAAVNESIGFFKENPVLGSTGEENILKGYHLRLVGDSQVWVDHVFAYKPKDSKEPSSEESGKKPESPDSGSGTNPPEAGSDKDDVAAPSAMSRAPIKKKQGGLDISGIGASFDSESMMLAIHLDATVAIGPMSAGIQGLTVNIDLRKAKGLGDLLSPSICPMTVSLQGLDVGFEKPPVMIAGGFSKTKGALDSDIYSGGIAISLSQLSIGAFGQYQRLPANPPDPAYDSVFIYAMLEGTLFTVGWAEVRGLIAGFGYNSRLRLPVGDELTNYPMLQGFDKPFMENMRLLQKDYLSTGFGSLWIAAGVVVRACQTMDIRAVAVLALGPDQGEVAILGRATAALPRGTAPDKALMVIDLSLIGKLDFRHGEFAIDAAINPSSFILHHDCRPSGGFAIRTWFNGSSGQENPHNGDWVVSFGGYHPAYAKPAHYPSPSRLRIDWAVTSQLSITGEAYATITPGVVMAGGLLRTVFEAGRLRAHFDARADFMVTLSPLHYTAQIQVFAGIEYEMRVWFITKKIAVELEASLLLYGPPLGGRAHFAFWVFGFDVEFGAVGGAGSANALTLKQFTDLVLEKADGSKPEEQAAAHVLAVTSGLVAKPRKPEEMEQKTAGEKEIWDVRSNDFSFTVRSKAPLSNATISNKDVVGQDLAGRDLKPSATILSRPMQIKVDNVKGSIDSSLQVRVSKGSTVDGEALPFRAVEAIVENVPNNLWGAYPNSPEELLNPSKMSETTKHIVGYKIVPPKAEVPGKEGQLEVKLNTWRQRSTEDLKPPTVSAGNGRSLDEEEMREAAKWKRVKAVTGDRRGASKRQEMIDTFLGLQKMEDPDTVRAYRLIGNNAPLEMLTYPERFYRSPPKVMYRQKTQTC